MQSFLKKDNFASKFAKVKEIVKICIIRMKKVNLVKVRIEKEMWTQKNVEEWKLLCFQWSVQFS